MERFPLPTVSLALTNAPQTELWDATFKVAGAKEQNKCSTSGSWSSLWMFSILLMDNLMKVSCVRQEKKKNISTRFLNTFSSLSLFFLHGRIPWNYFCVTELTQTCSRHWEDPTDHALHKHHARMFCVSDKAGSEGNLHLSWHSKAVTREIWRSYKLILKKKKRQQNWLHSHVRDSFQAEVWKQLHFTAWHSPRT